ncbi:MAG TPA: carboxylesterase family protein [Streptosporangiaceae bacterium]|nr:carboxylesterase family protein [Streptosporangiaceae bacterium]
MRPRRRFAGAKSVIASLAAALISFSTVVIGGQAAARASGAEPVVRTENGALRGVRSGGVDSFLGVPYAAPPVGAARWRPPRPAAPWRGVRAADAYGNRCAARASTNGPESDTEDCLYLNVQRPATARPGERLPVFFWIHGGGLVNGSSNQHDAGLIVRNTGVVVVTINYRLGVFGYLAHPALTAEAGASGDYGFMDQQAALRWVRRNIGAFGGDPRQVTIGGESAGGWSTCAHLTAPGSRGLFGRAIIQSGSCVTQPLDAAEAAGTTIAAAAGCADPAGAAPCLRGKTTTQLLTAASGANSFLMTHGVPALPVAPDAAVRAGDFARVPVVIGANRDEGRTFSQGFIGQTEEQYVAFVRSTFGADADAVLGRYPWPATFDAFTPAYRAGAILTDSGLIAQIGGCANRGLTRAFAGATPTYAYQFDHRTGPGLAPTPAGYVWGAGHAAELAYLWPSFDNGTPIAPTFDIGERRLALDMVRYWGSFVRSGRPAAAASARWARYDRTGQVLSLRAGGRSTLISDARLAAQHQCAFWDARG